MGRTADTEGRVGMSSTPHGVPAGRGPGKPSRSGGGQSWSFRPPSSEELQKVIVDGDPKVLVELAERIGKDLAQPEGKRNSPEALATSQIRAIFGKVRELDMRLRAGHVPSNAELDETTYRELQLLRPKLAYQAARAPGRGVTNLRKVLDPAIQLVERDRARFQHFVDFFEAILAYHRAHGGQ